MSQAPSQDVLIALRQLFDQRFSEGKLRTLCFDLAIEYESLPGEGKDDKARELVAYAARHDRVWDLVQTGQRLRPAGIDGLGPVFELLQSALTENEDESRS